MFALSLALTIVVTVAIILVFVVFVILENRFTSNYQSSLKKDTKAIEFLEGQYQDLQVNQDNHKYWSISREAIPDSALIDWLKHYVDGCTENDNFKVRVDHDKFIFLCWPSKLNSPVPQSPLHFVPTLLTTLGILGTFIGVSFGLSGIDLQSTSDFVALQKSVTSLIDGLKTAFYTSAFGMLLAVPSILFVIPLSLRKRKNSRDSLRNRLSKIAILETPTHFLSRMDNQSNQDAARELKQAAQVLSQLDMPGTEAIGSHVAAALRPAFADIAKDLAKQRQAIEAQRQELLTHLIGELRTEVVEPVVQRLDASAEMTRDASEAVRELKNELGGISQSLAGSVETIQLFQTKTLEELQLFAKSLQQTLHDFQSETKGVLEQVSIDVRSAVDQSIEGMKAQRAAFEESAVRASQVMDTARENLHSTLSNIDDMLRNTRLTVQEELEKFRDGYQGSLTTFLDQQNEQLSELLDQQRQGLTDVVDDLRQVFQNDSQVMSQYIHDSMENVRSTAKTVGDLVNTLGLQDGHQMAQIRELAKEMGDEVQRIETANKTMMMRTQSSYQNMSEQLEHALKIGNDRLSEYLEKASEVYVRNLNGFDENSAKVCRSLENTSIQFMAVADYLNESTQKLVSAQQSQNGHH
jgi:hypothetical protein